MRLVVRSSLTLIPLTPLVTPGFPKTIRTSPTPPEAFGLPITRSETPSLLKSNPPARLEPSASLTPPDTMSMPSRRSGSLGARANLGSTKSPSMASSRR